jgi:cytochrome oxidase Cu insertion factor (SCO1/SenC/PrrC family)/thiol-disulfide isomerase/thioredoxin
MLGAVTLLVIALGVVVIVGIGEPVRQAASVSLLPAPLAAGDPISPPRPTPNLQLIGADGRPTSLAAFRGKWLIFAPAMTLCHEVCPMTTGALMSLSSMLRKDRLASQVVVAEVTVDPWRDSPARLRAYRKMTGLDFELLTGTQAEIHRFWHFFGIYFKKVAAPQPPLLDWWTHRPVRMEVEHGDGLFFLDPAGHERIVVEGEANVHGHLPNAFLKSLLDKEGREILAHPRLPWSASQAMDDLDWLTGRQIPASEVRQAKAPSAAAASRELAGSPSQLAALHAQAGQLLGSTAQLDSRVKALRGYPVVLNAWASWCPPCQAEFPLFATASATYGRRVAFVGVDTEDEPVAAKAFLSHHPVSYPSYQTSSQGLAGLANVGNLPTTIYLGPEGKVRYVHEGQYETAAVLDSDIARHALGE